MNSQSKRVALWLRVSTQEQVEGDSLEHHEQRCRSYAELQGWEVAKIYRLEGISGKAILETSQAQEMLQDVKSGQIEALIFSKLARLARNTKELLEISQVFQDSNCAMISLQENIDTSSPSGRFFFTLLGAVGAWEREELVDRVKASVKSRAKAGKFLGGQAPYGYKVENQTLILNPDEAPIRKLLFELFLQHKRKKTVARLINEKGYRTRKGAKFSDTTIGRLLTDPIAKGLRRINYTKSLGEGKKWELKPEEEWEYVKVPAIVSEDVWNMVNSILEDQTQKRVRTTKLATHLFTNYVFCSCGEKMYLRTMTKKYTCKKCKSKIHKDDLERIFTELLKDLTFSEDLLEQEIQESDKYIHSLKEQILKLEKEKTKLENKTNSLIELHTQGELPTKNFKEHFTPVQKRIDEVNKELPRLEAEITALNIQKDSSDTLIKEAQDLYSNFPSFDEEQKRRIIELVTNKITVNRETETLDVDIIHFSPSPKGGNFGNANMSLWLFQSS